MVKNEDILYKQHERHGMPQSSHKVDIPKREWKISLKVWLVRFHTCSIQRVKNDI